MSQSEGNHDFPVLELVHSGGKSAGKLDDRLGQVDLGRTAVSRAVGARAFRNYNALTDVIELNKSGNLRGMVVSSKWHTVFRHISDSSKLGEYMENIGYLAALAHGIAESAPEFEEILRSQDSATLKGMQMLATAGTISERALLGVVPAGAHMIYRSLEGWCMLAGLAGGKAEAGASQCISTLHSADTLVQTTFKTISDTNNQSKAAWWVIDFVTSSRH
jgi:hypothetical protein